MSGLVKLSVSKVKTFADCKAKFNYSYNLRLPKKTWEHHTTGKFIHKILEDFHQEYVNGCKDPYHITLSRCFKVAKQEYEKDITPKIRDEVWEMSKSYLKVLHHKDDVDNVISCEKPFSLTLSENVNLNGAIDRIQRDDDGVLHVCDYKTVKSKDYLAKDFFQLLTYAYVCYLEDPTLTKVRASYICLRYDYLYITKEFTVDEIKTIPGKFLKYAEDMEKETEYPAKPSPLCDYCDFKEQCPKAFKRAVRKIQIGEMDF
jgi:RecB family exonuclease